MYTVSRKKCATFIFVTTSAKWTNFSLLNSEKICRGRWD